MSVRDKAEQRLPEDFAGLQEFIQWAEPDEQKRLEFRENQTMDNIRHFYGSMLPHVGNILAYLKRIDEGGDSIGSEQVQGARVLLYLMYGLSDAALSVEVHNSPTVPDGMPWDIWKPEHETPDWKKKPKIRLFQKEIESVQSENSNG